MASSSDDWRSTPEDAFWDLPDIDGEVRIGEDHFNDDISQQLARVIQEVGPGGRLLNERDLAAAMDVSRNALRDRLRLLEALGILERRQGAGTFIRPMKPHGLAFALDMMLTNGYMSLADLHVVRVALERQGAAEAAKGPDPASVAGMRRMVGIMTMSRTLDEVVRADAQFHHYLLKAAGNPALTFFADALQGVLHQSLAYRQLRWNKARGSRDLLVKVHQDIVLAIEGGEVLQAALATVRHFEAFEDVEGRKPMLRRTTSPAASSSTKAKTVGRTPTEPPSSPRAAKSSTRARKKQG
jgi:GntR family transcriptional regulator, transcriptional repressor for pyruvate dehydrogenase complex